VQCRPLAVDVSVLPPARSWYGEELLIAACSRARIRRGCLSLECPQLPCVPQLHLHCRKARPSYAAEAGKELRSIAWGGAGVRSVATVDVLLIIFCCHGEGGATRRFTRKMPLPVFPHLKQPSPGLKCYHPCGGNGFLYFVTAVG
jgi:hypothetical protein